MDVEINVIKDAEDFVRKFFQEHISHNYVFHSFEHTAQVVEACQEIANGFQLSDEELELLLLAGWFHDTGYNKGAEQHEKRSCEHARAFMGNYDYPDEDMRIVEECIMATKVYTNPNSLLEQILCDADLSHLGKISYWAHSGKLRHELTVTQNKIMSEQGWVLMELDFLQKHQYHTYVGHKLYSKRKEKHIKQLRKRQIRLDPTLEPPLEEIPPLKEKKKKKKKKKKAKSRKNNESGPPELKELNLGRGVETMYRTTYRTHVNLSSIADNKANIMLSINAIIISIIVSTLVPKFGENTKLIIPTVVLLAVCMLAIIYATLSTRPKITEGKFTREDIEKKRSNLLFFGNFYNMNIDDFHWGMMEMIKDSDFLYSSMTRDLYYLGIVLAKKYKYLSICYNVFMYGLIIAVITFAVVFIFV